MNLPRQRRAREGPILTPFTPVRLYQGKKKSGHQREEQFPSNGYEGKQVEGITSAREQPFEEEDIQKEFRRGGSFSFWKNGEKHRRGGSPLAKEEDKLCRPRSRKEEESSEDEISKPKGGPTDCPEGEGTYDYTEGGVL